MPHKKVLPLVLIAFLLGSIAPPSYTQDTGKSSKPIDLANLYQSIIDIKFPKPLAPPHGYLVMLTLRFFPPAETESQINITRNNDGQFNVVQYRLPSGSRSIDEQLGDLYYKSRVDTVQDPAEIAKRFKVEVRTVNMPSDVLTDLFDQLSQLHFPSIALKPSKFSRAPEGDDYKFWYKTDLNELYFRYVYAGHVDGDENATKFADWMDSVKKAVDSVK